MAIKARIYIVVTIVYTMSDEEISRRAGGLFITQEDSEEHEKLKKTIRKCNDGEIDMVAHMSVEPESVEEVFSQIITKEHYEALSNFFNGLSTEDFPTEIIKIGGDDEEDFTEDSDDDEEVEVSDDSEEDIAYSESDFDTLESD